MSLKLLIPIICLFALGCSDPIQIIDASGYIVKKDSCSAANGDQAWIISIDKETISHPKNESLQLSSGNVDGINYNSLIRVYFKVEEQYITKRIRFTNLNSINEDCEDSEYEIHNYTTQAYGEHH
jgi:hypothetical protein